MRAGLRVQVVLSLLAVAALGLGLLAPVVIVSLEAVGREVARTEARRTALVLAGDLARACPEGDRPCLEAALAGRGVGRLVSASEPGAVSVAAGPLGVVVSPGPASRARVADARRFLLRFLTLDLVVMVLLGAWVFIRGLVRPVERLADRVDSVARLELAPVPDGSQLGRLGGSFRRMVLALSAERGRVEAQIAELEAANRALQQAQEGLVRSERLATVGRLAAGVAHEIGNPLGGLMGYLELLRKKTPPEDARRPLVTGAQEAAGRIDRTIRDLLDFSRPAAGETGTFDLSGAVDEALRLVVSQRRFARVEVRRDLPDALPRVRADRRRLVQVLLNLLLNAGDAMDGVGRVVLRASTEGGQVVLRVADTGPGLPEGAGDRIFEPFFTTKPPGQGTGLGLATSRALVEAWGGRLEAGPAPEGGAEFSLTLPVSV